ncbi:MAG: ABC transporter ATP-binding protein [Cytophagales bacterium]|nr:ABC transporter ATP-binding protein [Cytophagales bacterium]
MTGRDRDSFRTLRKLLGFIKPYSSLFYLVVGLSLVLSVLAPLRPYLIRMSIDRDLAARDTEGLWEMLLLLLGLLLIHACIQFCQLYLSGILGQNVIRNVRMKVFRHLQRMKLRVFDKTPVGQLMTRCVSDVETLSDIFTEGLASIAGDSLQLISITVLMFIVDWRLALVSLSSLPLLLISTYIFKEKIKVSFRQVRQAVGQLNAFVQEHITGMSIIQLFNHGASEYEKFKKINKVHRQAHMRSVLYYSIYYPVTEIAQAMAIGLIIWYGARGVIADRLSIGLLISFIMYIIMLYRPIRMIADKFNTVQMGIAGAQRIFQLMDDKTVLDDSGHRAPHQVKGHIVFEDVWVSYGKEQVLKGISFEILPGQKIGLVGHTGSGKTTLVQSLTRFYDIEQGTIYLDGISIQEFEPSSLRQKIGLVLQDPFLFSDSIRNNITLYQPFPEENLRRLAEEVGAWKFIKACPNGWDFQVMERGGLLSAGQRQLISLMRVMLTQPPILVLDEATSSIDSHTEQTIQQALNTIQQGRTCLIIAHRLSTLRKVDKIIVLNEGQVAEIGTHPELLKKGGLYAQFHKASQST